MWLSSSDRCRRLDPECDIGFFRLSSTTRRALELSCDAMLAAALARVPAGPRLLNKSWSPSTFLAHCFSTTPVAAKYKLKSHSGAKKRWKALASGVFKRVRELELTYDTTTDMT
jgi:hypothetical protein